MGLTDKEKQQLEALTKKSKEPDSAPVGRSIRANIDLGDAAQVALAIKHGFLTADEVEDEKDKKDEKDDDKDDTPRRRGYFKSE